jgi:hypothetical protein
LFFASRVCTIEDNIAMVCFGSSGKPFALVVHVRTNDKVHAVLTPAYEGPESAATYMDFLKNNNETLRVNYGKFDPNDGCWHVDRQSIEVKWPKHDKSFEFPDG